VHHKLGIVLLLLPLSAMLLLPLIALAQTGSLEIKGAEVYSGYLEEGDWLIVVSYNNTLEPYYGNDTSQDAFLLQLTKADDTLIAQVPLTAWGYRPGSIYLSAITVSTLEWGAAYKVGMYGTDAVHNTTNYTLTAADWRGSNLAILDDWCLSLARAMEIQDSATYLTMTTAKGEVLNEEGGVIFVIGIPALNTVRLNLFQIVTSDIPYEEPDWTSAYWDTLPTWEEAVGDETASVLNAAGNLIDAVGGRNVGILFIIIFWAAIATTSFAVGHGTAGMALTVPILVLGVYFGFIPFAVMGVAIAIVVALLARELWWSKT